MPTQIKIPDGMTQVSKKQFFGWLMAERRNVMPSNTHPDYTTWETRNRKVVAWSSPGWRESGNPNTKKVWAVDSQWVAQS